MKDAFHRYVINGEKAAVNPELKGTKAALQYTFTVPAGGEISLKLRLQKDQPGNLATQHVGHRILKTLLPRATLKPTSSIRASFLPTLAMTRAM